MASLLPQQVQDRGLHVVAEGTDGTHQPVGAEAGVAVHHTLSDVHLEEQTEQDRSAKCQ